MQTFLKQPVEVRDIDVDFSAFFEALGGDSIASASIAIAPSGSLTLGPGSLPDYNLIENNQTVKVWLGGGTDGTTYQVTVTMTATSGRVIEQEFRVRVKEL